MTKIMRSYMPFQKDLQLGNSIFYTFFAYSLNSFNKYSMRKLLKVGFIFFCVFNCQFLNCQNYHADLMKEANKALNFGEYALADSIYSLCVSKSLNGDIYYNRAIARIGLNDTCGYCSDLEVASFNFFDKEAMKLYQKHCMKSSDTVYFTKDYFRVTKDQKFRFYDVTRSTMCDKYIRFEVHDKTKKIKVFTLNMNNLSTAVNHVSATIDCIARAYIINDTTFFHEYRDVTMNDIIDPQIQIFKKNLKSYISSNYSSLKNNQTDILSLNINILLTAEGKVRVKNVGEIRGHNPNFAKMTELKAGIVKAFNNISRLDPTLLIGKPINFENGYVFEF